MDLELTDEQKLLSTSVQTLLERGGDEEEVWEKLVEFGGLMVDPEALGAVELCLIARNLGAHLASVPYLGSAATRYAVAGAEQLPPAFAALAEESTAVSIAMLEPGGGWSPEGISSRRGAGGLEGEKCAVEHTAAADALLVVFREEEGLALTLLPGDAAGVEISAEDSIDASVPLSRVSLAGADVSEEGVLSGAAAQAAVDRLAAIGALLAAADGNGAAGVMLEQATEYAGQRRQFGRTIGSNQALRHILADMYVRHSASWSSILYTAAALDDGAEEAVRSVSISKAFASRASREVAHGAMQVFGGIAFTEEHDAHRFLRRINLRGSQFGDAEHHERLLGRGIAAGATRTAVAA